MIQNHVDGIWSEEISEKSKQYMDDTHNRLAGK